MATIADTIRKALVDGKTNLEVLEIVKATHPNANTSLACVSYYRSKMKKAGSATVVTKVPSAVKKTVKAMMTLPTYSAKSLRSFTGQEGLGYHAVLYRDQTKVARVFDSADGGALLIDWFDKGGERVDVTGVNCMGQPFSYKGTPEEKRLMDFVNLLPPHVCSFIDEKTGEPAVLAVSMDLFIGRTVEDGLVLKKVTSLFKKGVTFVEDQKLYTVKTPATAEGVASVKALYPKAVILNGMGPSEILEAVRGVA